MSSNYGIDFLIENQYSLFHKVFTIALSRRRIVIENINVPIKVFKVISYPYRNRRRGHLLRTKLVCTIRDAEKTLSVIGQVY